MTATPTRRPAATAPPLRPAAAKPAWSAPVVECHRTGAEVTAYAGQTAPWRNR
ncbi:hypothetical protein [Streptomyces fodineus]|uniref:hypothetical protein n=1 Tax=Streptomyces fodineus TaxID=1904616 RepID=UPI000A9B6F44|nr:hypothetical protein [Streptomyces fodineus]